MNAMKKFKDEISSEISNKMNMTSNSGGGGGGLKRGAHARHMKNYEKSSIHHGGGKRSISLASKFHGRFRTKKHSNSTTHSFNGVSSNDPYRFNGDGIDFKAKLIGIQDVDDARGEYMCQIAMQTCKALIKRNGHRKQKIWFNLSSKGFKIKDQNTGIILFNFPVAKISFIAKDMVDPRAFGFVHEGLERKKFKFYGIKTEKPAEQVVLAIRDMFQIVYEATVKQMEEEAHARLSVTSENHMQIDKNSRHLQTQNRSLSFNGDVGCAEEDNGCGNSNNTAVNGNEEDLLFHHSPPPAFFNSPTTNHHYSTVSDLKPTLSSSSSSNAQNGTTTVNGTNGCGRIRAQSATGVSLLDQLFNESNDLLLFNGETKKMNNANKEAMTTDPFEIDHVTNRLLNTVDLRSTKPTEQNSSTNNNNAKKPDSKGQALGTFGFLSTNQNMTTDFDPISENNKNFETLYNSIASSPGVKMGGNDKHGKMSSSEYNTDSDVNFATNSANIANFANKFATSDVAAASLNAADHSVAILAPTIPPRSGEKICALPRPGVKKQLSSASTGGLLPPPAAVSPRTPTSPADTDSTGGKSKDPFSDEFFA